MKNWMQARKRSLVLQCRELAGWKFSFLGICWSRKYTKCLHRVLRCSLEHLRAVVERWLQCIWITWINSDFRLRFWGINKKLARTEKEENRLANLEIHVCWRFIQCFCVVFCIPLSMYMRKTNYLWKHILAFAQRMLFWCDVLSIC